MSYSEYGKHEIDFNQINSKALNNNAYSASFENEDKFIVFSADGFSEDVAINMMSQAIGSDVEDINIFEKKTNSNSNFSEDISLFHIEIDDDEDFGY